MNNFSDLSKALTDTLDSQIQKKEGIFFTPYRAVIQILDIVEKIGVGKNILEPSCGSGQFLDYLTTRYPEAYKTGIEYNPDIFAKISQKYNSSGSKGIRLINQDFLTWNGIDDSKFDLIIGNPPFYVMKKKDVPPSFQNDQEKIGLVVGRPNIFILFIIHSLTLLRENGVLAFVLPKNFLNCLYYDPVRKLIKKSCKIIAIREAEGEYLKTSQDTIITVFQRCPTESECLAHNKKWCWSPLDYPCTIMMPDNILQEIETLLSGSTTLDKLGVNVSVGSVVWNEHKDILSKSPESDKYKTRLIYSSEIKDGSLIAPVSYSNTQKGNYIDLEGWNDTIIVVNRGYGVGKYSFQYALVDKEKVGSDYLIENHLIYLRQKESGENLLFEKILASFNRETTKKFIKLYFGNNAINVTELQHIFPIWLD